MSSCAAPLGLYVHLPFCVRKCHYCDFVSGPVGLAGRKSYLQALHEEIRSSPWAGSPARTLFLGGGTPSELRLDELAALVEVLEGSFDLAECVERTIECNPGTLTEQALPRIRRLGFDRISLGVQSFQDRFLHDLGRVHDAEDARRAVARARKAGFDNLNLDLIFALPGQSLEDWRQDLLEAIAFQPDHLSLYQLTVEAETEFGRRKAAGRLREAGQELGAQMFELAMDVAAPAGYQHYEISNFALPGKACLHNRIYWRNQPYLGFGVSAASYLGGVRWTNLRDLDQYTDGVSQHPPRRATEERLDPYHALAEEILLGLRTSDGIRPERLSEKYGIDFGATYSATVRTLQEGGFLHALGDRLVLSRPGKLVADSVCAEFFDPDVAQASLPGRPTTSWEEASRPSIPGI